MKFEEIKHLMLKKIQNMMDVKEVLLLWFIKFLIERFLVEQLNICQYMSNQQLAEELHKSIFEKLKKKSLFFS